MLAVLANNGFGQVEEVEAVRERMVSACRGSCASPLTAEPRPRRPAARARLVERVKRLQGLVLLRPPVA